MQGRREGSQAESIQPLPGGVGNYPQTLARLIELCADPLPLDDYFERVMTEYPTVQSRATAEGYLYGVLCVMRFAQVSRGVVQATPAGRQYAAERDPKILQAALCNNVRGVTELLEELAVQPRPIGLLLEAMRARGFTWTTVWQVRFRLRWLLVAGMATRRSHRDSKHRYPEWAQVDGFEPDEHADNRAGN